MSLPALILQAAGTGRDRAAARACQLAGGAPAIVPVGAPADAVEAGERRRRGSPLFAAGIRDAASL